jgi:uncharacterized protein (TIGR04255 family)
MTAVSGKPPSFSRPPVVEVVTGVQFQKIPGLHAGHFGLFWDRVRDRFPQVRHQQPLLRSVERQVEGNLPSRHGIRLQPMAAEDFVPRIWFIDTGDCELLQIQTDRFIRNWRKRPANTVYPRYFETIRPAFAKDLGLFMKFLTQQKLSVPVFDQCELTYINHIHPAGIWEEFARLDKVFAGWQSGYCDGVWADPESVAVRTSHALLGKTGEFIGRLYLEIDSAFTSEGVTDAAAEKTFVMKLIARGRPLGEGAEGVFLFLDLAHEQIVRGFDKITTPQMHAAWGKE